MKVAIVVNSNVQGKARPCFWRTPYWKKIFDEASWEIEYISIADDIANNKIPPVKLFRIDKIGTKLYDLIIVSWDAINGDPVFLSDIGLRFFLHCSPNLDLWVQKGGVIIVEFQSAAFRLVQESYNAFNYDYASGRRINKIEVAPGAHAGIRARWQVNTDHPLMRGVTKVLIEEAVGPGGHFAPGEVAAVLGEEVKSAPGYDLDVILANLSRGWFVGSHKSWYPVLWADKRFRILRRPIMLVRHVLENGSAGAYVVTAMLLSNPRFHQGKIIVKNAAELPNTLGTYLQQVKTRRISRIGEASAVSFISGVLILASLNLAGFPGSTNLFSGLGTAVVMYLLTRYLLKK